MERAYNDAVQKLEASQSKLSNLTGLKTQFSEMQTEVTNGNKTLSDYSGLLSSISSISPTAASAVAAMKSGAMDATEGFHVLNEELNALIENESRISSMEFAKAMQNYQMPSDLKGAVKDYTELLNEMTQFYGYTEDMSNTDIYKMLYNIPSNWDAFAEAIEDYNTMYAFDDISKQFGVVLNRLMSEFNNDIDQVVQSAEGQQLFGRLWDMLLGDMSQNEAAVRAEFDKQADLFIDVVNYSLKTAMSDVQAEGLKQVLWNKLAGPDGILTPDELSNLGKVFGESFSKVMRDGVENSDLGPAVAKAAEMLTSQLRREIAEQVGKESWAE